MASATKHALDYAAYAISAAVIGGGTVYAVHHLQASPTPPPFVAETPSAQASTPPPVVAATPPAPAPVPASPPPAAAPAPPPVAAAPTAPTPPGVITTATRTYVLPQPADSPGQDRATYLALQKNCYDAAANNRNGQYPALQAAACNSYARFAGEHGWNTGQMPPYGQAPAVAMAPADVESGPAYQDGPEMVVYDAAIGGYRRIQRQFRDSGTRRQIGPNYALPPPQAPPAVSQEQHRTAASRAASPYRPH